MPKKWKIEIKAPFLGFAPSFWTNSYPTFGKVNQAGRMTNISLADPTKMTQGPSLTALTSGTQAGKVKTLIEHILNIPSSNNVTWGTGGKYVYKISATAVSAAIEIVGVGNETGKSVVYNNGYVYCFYNDSGAAGEIAKVTASNNAIDPDWGSTTPATGASALVDAPHPAILGGDGIIYFGNGRYVGYYDPVNDILSVDELDLPADCEVIDLVWEKNLLFISTNSPNVATGNTNLGIIYAWDTVADTFQEPIIEVPGRLGALIVKNGLVFPFYQDLSDTGGFKLGYINGDAIVEIEGFTGTLPVFGQACHYKNHIAFLSNAQIYLWGASSSEIPTALTQFADGGYATAGALSNPFGTPMVASTESTNYQLVKLAGLSILSSWQTLNYDVATSIVDKVVVHYEPTSTGAGVGITIKYNRGNTTYPATGAMSITHANDGTQIKKAFYPKIECDDFCLIPNWSVGSQTNELAIRKIEVFGHIVEKN